MSCSVLPSLSSPLSIFSSIFEELRSSLDKDVSRSRDVALNDGLHGVKDAVLITLTAGHNIKHTVEELEVCFSLVPCSIELLKVPQNSEDVAHSRFSFLLYHFVSALFFSLSLALALGVSFSQLFLILLSSSRSLYELHQQLFPYV